MSKTVDEAIRDLQVEIAKDEAALQKKKETVNTLCTVVGRPPIYAAQAASEPSFAGPVRADQFYGQPLAAAVRTILEMRKNANLGAASVAEVYDVLVSGGYRFETKNEDIARKSLRNSLAKNTALFHKLPNGRFGLGSWYPKVRDRASAPLPDESEEEEPAGPRQLTHRREDKE